MEMGMMKGLLGLQGSKEEMTEKESGTMEGRCDRSTLVRESISHSPEGVDRNKAIVKAKAPDMLTGILKGVGK
jgi:hypothetical protein